MMNPWAQSWAELSEFCFLLTSDAAGQGHALSKRRLSASPPHEVAFAGERLGPKWTSVFHGTSYGGKCPSVKAARTQAPLR